MRFNLSGGTKSLWICSIVDSSKAGSEMLAACWYAEYVTGISESDSRAILVHWITMPLTNLIWLLN